jgi:hypothetical protein
MRDDAKLVGGRDFASFVPVFQNLAGEAQTRGSAEGQSATWSSLMGLAALRKVHPRITASAAVPLCTAVMFESIRCMYDAEMMVRMAALAALRRLVSDLVSWIVDAEGGERDDALITAWQDVITCAIMIMPAIHRGLKEHDSDEIRRGFLLLLLLLLLLSHCISAIVGRRSSPAATLTRPSSTALMSR